MLKRFYYLRKIDMEPRPGVSYATSYIRMTDRERDRLAQWLSEEIRDIFEEIESDPAARAASELPLRGFPRQGKPNRSLLDILCDTAETIAGRRSSGQPKDFPLAVIDRWNRFFRGTRREFFLKERP